jgi:hypothetical protein
MSHMLGAVVQLAESHVHHRRSILVLMRRHLALAPFFTPRMLFQSGRCRSLRDVAPGFRQMLRLVLNGTSSPATAATPP